VAVVLLLIHLTTNLRFLVDLVVAVHLVQEMVHQHLDLEHQDKVTLAVLL